MLEIDNLGSEVNGHDGKKLRICPENFAEDVRKPYLSYELCSSPNQFHSFSLTGGGC